MYILQRRHVVMHILQRRHVAMHILQRRRVVCIRFCLGIPDSQKFDVPLRGAC